MCVLRNGPLFCEGDLVRWEFRQFSKKLSCRAKLKKCRKKSYGVRAMGKIFLLSLLFISDVKNVSHKYSPPRNYAQPKSERKIISQKIAQFTYSKKKCWFLELRERKVINTFATHQLNLFIVLIDSYRSTAHLLWYSSSEGCQGLREILQDID